MKVPCAWTWPYVLKHDPSLSWILDVNEPMKLKCPNHLLDKFKAISPPRGVALIGCSSQPPKTYITSPRRTAAWCVRGDGMDPVHCNSVHFRVEMSNDQMSLKSCVLPRPPNLRNVIMRVDGEGMWDTNMMIRPPEITEI
jgi:hypothetical protein